MQNLVLLSVNTTRVEIFTNFMMLLSMLILREETFEDRLVQLISWKIKDFHIHFKIRS